MNSNEELAAKKVSRNLTAQKDKQAAITIIRYIVFYLSVIYFLSLYSYLLDWVFYNISYGTFRDYRYSPIQYIFYYIIIGYVLFPLSIIYNYFINRLKPQKNHIRILIGLFATIAFGFLLSNEGHFGYYIGKYRPLKNTLVLALTGISVEFLRILVVRIRIKDKRIKQYKEKGNTAFQ